MGVGPQRLIRALGTEVGTPQWEPYGVTGFFIIAGLIPPDSLPRPVLGLELPGEGYPSWLVFGQQPNCSMPLLVANSSCSPPAAAGVKGDQSQTPWFVSGAKGAPWNHKQSLSDSQKTLTRLVASVV